MSKQKFEQGFAWQLGVWDGMAETYQREIDSRFAPIVELLLAQAELRSGEKVIDLGTGTGAVALCAAEHVGDGGSILAVDISSQMLAIAQARGHSRNITNIEFKEGSGEAVPAEDQSQNAVLASLSLMYVIDRAAAAEEIARVLRPGGRFVGVVWAGPEETDIVKFQQTAGSFAPKPPVDGVGPGSMADVAPFLNQLSAAGLKASAETAETEFAFPSFDAAWAALAAVTTASLDVAVQDEARKAVRELMWPSGDGPRTFRNKIRIITAAKP